MAIGKNSKRKLYALLVGINNYREDLILNESGTLLKFPALSGCVSDTKKMRVYLNQEKSEFSVDIKMLTNEEATRMAIIYWFREHFKNAGKDDVVLFYFSGHGTREYADRTLWLQESDGILECLVCHYDEKTLDSFRLADKELRYLIHELSQKNPHIVTIFDCCHAGDNTRNGEVTAAAFSDTIEKKIPYVFPLRQWAEFIFASELDEQIIRQNGLPEGMHVQMSACEDNESSFEVKQEGVFTKTLLKVLNASAGHISYIVLQNRVRQYLRNVYQQTPRIYIPDESKTLLHAPFLTKKNNSFKAAFGEVIYNQKLEWVLNMGGIHGIGDKLKTLTVLHPQDSTQQFEATVERVYTDTTQLLFKKEDVAKLDKDLVYNAYVENLLAHTLLVNFQNEDGLLVEQKAMLDELFNNKKSYIKLTEVSEKVPKPDYVIHNRNGRFYISFPNDPFRPLVAPIKTGYEEAPKILIDDLKHISQWSFLKGLANTSKDTTLKGSPLKIDVFYVSDDGTEILVPIVNNEADIDFKLREGQWKTTLRFRLTNTTDNRLYCSAIYLTHQFKSYVNYLNPAVYSLNPGESVALRVKDRLTGTDRTTIGITLGEVTKLYNWPKFTEYLKFIVSTDEFSVDSLRMDALPAPPTPKTKFRGGEVARNMEMDDDPQPEVKGWTTQRLILSFRNPEPDIIDEADLKAMLEDPDIADFALWLYFDVNFGENQEAMYSCKNTITVRSADQSLRQKGLITNKLVDLANWWARRRRYNRFQETRRRLPDHPIIVSEGDSWFQHPLIKDTIDCIASSYPVYCVAAAGDTLVNYVKDGDEAEFLLAIKEYKPLIFLISGGGNDVLGSQFRQYLINPPGSTAKPGENPERFLKSSLLGKLDELGSIYTKQIFGHLNQLHSDLYIIAHGYDYIIPLDINTDGWLGRHMINVGIGPTDRRAIIRYILNEFNQRLKLASEGFQKVTYIDVRGTVGSDQWYDEIHPDEVGFQLVADKFLERIRQIIPIKTNGY